MESLYRVLERYLEARSATLLLKTAAHYRRHIRAFIDFLCASHPEVDCLAKLRRSPHIESWLQKLLNVQPPYKNGSRDQYIRQLRRFLEDIRQWGWPDSPPAGLIRLEDFPRPKPSSRARRRLKTLSGFPRPGHSLHQALRRYLEIRGATLRPSTVSHYRIHVLSLIDLLQQRFPEVSSFARLDRSHLEAWLVELAEMRPPYHNATRWKYIANVRRFLEDICQWCWPESPPEGLIRPDDFPPAQRYLPRPLAPAVDAVLIEPAMFRTTLLSVVGVALLVGLSSCVRSTRTDPSVQYGQENWYTYNTNRSWYYPPIGKAYGYRQRQARSSSYNTYSSSSPYDSNDSYGPVRDNNDRSSSRHCPHPESGGGEKHDH